MLDDTRDGCTRFYCDCAGTRAYTHSVCGTCGGVEPPPDDLVAEMRGFAKDHEPDGWPAVRMRQITALCDEVDDLRNALSGLLQAQTAMIRERVTEAQRAEYEARGGKAWLVASLNRKRK